MCETCDAETEYRRRAGITCRSLEELRSFLDEYDDVPAFAVQYTDDDSHERLVADVRVIERSVERPAAAIALACTPLRSSEDEWTVRFDRIDLVAALEAPEGVIPGDAEASPANFGAYLNLARVDPGAIDVGGLVAALQAADHEGREVGLGPLRSAAHTKPAACTMALPFLRDRLAEGDHETTVLEIVAAIAEECPGDVAPFVDGVVDHLDSPEQARRAAAAECVSSVAVEAPSDVLDAAPALASLVDDRDESLAAALYALNRIAADHPGEVRPAAGVLADAVGDPSLSDSERLNATATLGRVVGEYPDAGLAAVEDLCNLLEADDHRLAANAAGVLGDLAQVHTGELVPYVDDLAPLLEADDDYTLVNTTAALSRVAATAPEAVEELADRFVDLLDHEHDLVRLNACWALGHVAAQTAREPLDEVRRHDADERVRNRAAWAIAEIEGWDHAG